MKAVILMPNGFEDIEFIVPVDILRRAGVTVDTVSLIDNDIVESGRKVRMFSDKLLYDVNLKEYDLIYLPGGPGTANYFNSKKFMKELKIIAKSKNPNQYIAAICAAPIVLSSIGMLKGKKAICYSSQIKTLAEEGAIIINEQVVQDGNILTAAGAGATMEFALTIVELLLGKNKRREIMCEIHLNE